MELQCFCFSSKDTSVHQSGIIEPIAQIYIYFTGIFCSFRSDGESASSTDSTGYSEDSDAAIEVESESESDVDVDSKGNRSEGELSQESFQLDHTQ